MYITECKHCRYWVSTKCKWRDRNGCYDHGRERSAKGRVCGWCTKYKEPSKPGQDGHGQSNINIHQIILNLHTLRSILLPIFAE